MAASEYYNSSGLRSEVPSAERASLMPLEATAQFSKFSSATGTFWLKSFCIAVADNKQVPKVLVYWLKRGRIALILIRLIISVH